MREYTREITGQDYLPNFTAPVLYQHELVGSLHDLHLMILEEQSDFGKEELLLLLLEQLLRDYADAESSVSSQDVTIEVKCICEYIESHYMESISLGELAERSGMSKYHLVRLFTRQKASHHIGIWKRFVLIRPNAYWNKERCPLRYPPRRDSAIRAILRTFQN